MASRASTRTIGVKVDHQAVGAAAAAAAKRELEAAGQLGERMIRIWQYAIGSEEVGAELHHALTGVETLIGIDGEGRPLPGVESEDERETASAVPDDGAQGLR